MNNHRSSHVSFRRLGAFTTLGAAGLVGLLALGGTANAGDGDDDYEPTPEINIDDLLVPDGPVFEGPIVSIPNGPDGPVFEGPIVTIPVTPDDDPVLDGPIFDGPILTIPIAPGDTTPPEDAPPPTDAPVDPPEDPISPPAETTPEPTSPSGVAPFVQITSATVDCAGMVNVTYETGAAPALSPETEHVVMFSPASNPAAVTSHRLFQRPVDGTFTVALQSPAAEAYRVFVVADFEPANLEGVALVDEADATAPVDCPTPSS